MAVIVTIILNIFCDLQQVLLKHNVNLDILNETPSHLQGHFDKNTWAFLFVI